MADTFEYTDSLTGNSTWIEAIYYNAETERLAVRTKREECFFYGGVPESTFYRAGDYASLGEYYISVIKGRFRYLSGERGATFVKVDQGDDDASETVPDILWNLDFDVVCAPVPGANVEEAIANFRADPGKYMTYAVRGVNKV